MFRDCTGLETPPASLPADSLAAYCYDGMFRECSALVSSPAISATNTAPYSCEFMFHACKSLTDGPALMDPSPESWCYYAMFANDAALSSLSVGFSEWYSNTCTTNWMNDVAPTGVFYCPAALPNERGGSRIPNGWTKVSPAPPIVLSSCVCIEALSANSTVTAPVGSVYSADGGATWTGGTATLANAGDKVYVKAEESRSKVYPSKFVLGGAVKASGNAQSLLDPAAESLTAGSEAFRELFSGCSALKDASGLELPATSLGTDCYREMFKGCTGLTAAPALPATSLGAGCYSKMLSGCTALAEAPDLPATTMNSYCYQHMFDNCTSLRETPYLPAASLTEKCYEAMFQGCS